jgi:hypothetical protein
MYLGKGNLEQRVSKANQLIGSSVWVVCIHPTRSNPMAVHVYDSNIHISPTRGLINTHGTARQQPVIDVGLGLGQYQRETNKRKVNVVSPLLKGSLVWYCGGFDVFALDILALPLPV